MKKFKDKVAFITGGNSGIGYSTAIHFAKEGANVVIAARRKDEGDYVVKQIEKLGAQAHFFPTDIRLKHDIDNSINKTISLFGKLDYAINNAGMQSLSKGILDLTEAEWDNAMSINLKSSFLLIQAEARVMLEKSKGVIINIGSILSHICASKKAEYVSAKHGLHGLTKVASAELAPLNIRVNTVCPGFVDTPMYENSKKVNGADKLQKHIESITHIKRVGHPDEIAKTILWLCSEDASYITGASIVVDGGILATNISMN